MDYAIELYKILSSSFSGNKARIKTMSIILIGLAKALTSNLSEVAKNMPGNISLSSKYRKIQRFFQQVSFKSADLTGYLLPLLFSEQDKFTLIIDRTNWKLGSSNTNLLVLSVVWHGISLPIAWNDLNKAGNSTTIEKMKIVSEAIRAIGTEKIDALIGDREFIGEDWIHWLELFKIKFVLRIRNNSKLFKNHKYHKAKKSFRTLSRCSSRYIKADLWDASVWIVGYKDKDGNLLILATNFNPDKSLSLYSLRWQIESMFLSLKSNGFNLEKTKMICPDKIHTLFSLLAILTFWNCKIGKWANKVKPIKIKYNKRPEYNYFKYGMRIITSIFNNIIDYAKDFRKILKILLILPDKLDDYEPGKMICL